jgi:lysyl-tRNA synthetase class II
MKVFFTLMKVVVFLNIHVGIDSYHNPEFTTCEFYEAYTTLDNVIALTQELLTGSIFDIQLS